MITAREMIYKYPDLMDRKIAWLGMDYRDSPYIQDVFPELDINEREILILKSRGFDDETIESIMKHWEKSEEEEL